MRGLSFAGALGAILAVVPLAGQTIPMKPGVTLVYATQPTDTTQRADFEREITVDSVTPDEVRLSDDATNLLKPSNRIASIHIDRPYSHREAALARSIWLGNVSPDVDPHRGFAWMSASTVVMRQLRADGRADVTVGQSGFKGTATMHRVDSTPVPITVLVNGHPTTLLTLHAHIDVPAQLNQLASAFQGASYDLWFLEDTSIAWVVRLMADEKFADGPKPGLRTGLQELVRVQWVDQGTQQAMAAALAKTCRVEAAGIHFATASAEITSSSDPTLRSIAQLLVQHPDWQITIEGHTDSLGGAAYNKDLSDRRAAAVKAALTTRYGVSAARLATAGYGQSRPVDSNKTLAGRARNRRVELARKC